MHSKQIDRNSVTITWEPVEGAEAYRIYWADKDTSEMQYRFMTEVPADRELIYRLERSTHVPHYFTVKPVIAGEESQVEERFSTPVYYIQKEQLEVLGRGLVAVPARQGIFLSWRIFLSEVYGADSEHNGMAGVEFAVYRGGSKIAMVSHSSNYLDQDGRSSDTYAVAPVTAEGEQERCVPVRPWSREYLDIPLQKPEGGVTPVGQAFDYSANDMSVADVDGDGEYEYIVKWDPSNSQDVSIKGYTGHCYIDCYKLDGTIIWRLDMGQNIRAGAHYTQFICYDFNGDGKAEMSVKTAPGTRMTVYNGDGSVKSRQYITMCPEDVENGYSHEDDYVCSAEAYRCHLVELFRNWRNHPEVERGCWPATLEECFGIKPSHAYPLDEKSAAELVDYFLDVYAPSRSGKNDLRRFEGFIYQGPEYLTMFGGDGSELQTIPFKFGRVDDGLMWGDYAMNRIEPCNRVDRFLSAVGYLDGERPYLLICRGYYTRTTIVAYSFFQNQFEEYWSVDSGFVPMDNPFCANPHEMEGTDPQFGCLAGQGNHSVSIADVDGDGCMEVIYGAACIDHDGTVLYSSRDRMPDGREVKLGHGDAMHVANVDPDRPGLEIFNVFEGASAVPYGYALRDAETGEVLFGQFADSDLGRCMVGDMVPGVRGLQCWINDVAMYDCHGKTLDIPTPGTNMSIRWAADLSTQITDGVDYLGKRGRGVINDITHGIMLNPEDTLTNNGTKGNPCLVADIFGDFREEILLRTKDSSAVRIYTNTEITAHKLFTLMHDAQYRCGAAWQNNCYNQPVYTKFYFASDMDFDWVLPYNNRRPVIYLAGDSTMQSYGGESRPQTGWGEALMKYLDEGNIYRTYHRKNSGFPQQIRYESRNLIIDNCAMAGRSSKSFRDEQRLADIEANIHEGDFLLIQFGHNDADSLKPERFVPVDEFEASLMAYVEAAFSHGAVPILVSSITMRPCPENQQGDAGRINGMLPEYRRVMEEMSGRYAVPYVDMGALTEELCGRIEESETRKLYKEDNVHLVKAGAEAFARLAADEIKKLLSGRF